MGSRALGLQSYQGTHDASGATPHISDLGGGIFTLGFDSTDPALRFDDTVSRTMIIAPTSRTLTTAGAEGGWMVMPATATITLDLPVATIGGILAVNSTFEFQQDGNSFGAGNIFRASMVVKNVNGVAASFGSQYTWVNTNTYQADGAAISSLFIRNTLAQFTLNTINGGTLAVTLSLNIGGFLNPSILTGVTVTNKRDWEWAAGTYTGTVTNNDCLYVANITGGTNFSFIRSFINSGATRLFINHTGTGRSLFSGDLHMANSVNLALGDFGGTGVILSRESASAFRMQGFGGTFNEALEWQFDANNNVRLTSPTGASLNINTIELAFGPGVTADGTNNFVMVFAPGLRATQLDGDYSEVLFTSSSAIAVAHAIGTFATWTVNAPTINLSGGTVTNSANVLIQTNMNQGSNDRAGLRITSNPTGGAGVNAALHVTAGLSRFDGRVDINNGIALGAGAAATLGLIGGTGPTAAAQAQWVEIDIAGVSHWIAVWV